VEVASKRRRLVAVLISAAFVLAGCASLPKRSPAQIAADDATAGRVYAALEDNPIYFFGHVDVSVDNGVACLSGVVWTTDALYHAKKIARTVPGVIAVHDELELARAARRGGGDGGN
jgi:osmotically-inducible protein OsmY